MPRLPSLLCFLLVLSSCQGTDGSETQPTQVVEDRDAFENNRFANLGEMIEFSSTIVSGTVSAVTLNRSDEIEPEGIMNTVLTIEIVVDEPFKDDGTENVVSFEFQGPDVNPGTPLEEFPRSSLNGVPVPSVGDRLLLFLNRLGVGESQGANPATHGLVNFDGILEIHDDGSLETSLEGANRIGHMLATMTVDEVAGLIDDPGAAAEVAPSP